MPQYEHCINTLANLVESSLFVMNAFFMNMLWGKTSFSRNNLGLEASLPFLRQGDYELGGLYIRNLKETAELKKKKNQEIGH